jgi:hypothetical protein
MSEELLYRVAVGFSSGLGFLLAGGLGLLLTKKSFFVRLGAAVPVAAASGFLSAFVVPLSIALLSAGVSVLTVVIVSVLGSTPIASTIRAGFARARRPAGQSLLFVVGGAALMTGAIAHLTNSEEAAADDDMQWMLETTYRPALDPVADVSAVTDRGESIPLHKVRAPRTADQIAHSEGLMNPDAKARRRLYMEFPPSEDCNCHGWVFTGGKYWLAGDSVEIILSENGYHTVSDPRPGDVVIYREGGLISHTALVYSALPSRPIMVEGKWGTMGVYLHAIGESGYGQSYTFHRSTREGHVLAGLDGKSIGTSQNVKSSGTRATGTD